MGALRWGKTRILDPGARSFCDEALKARHILPIEEGLFRANRMRASAIDPVPESGMHRWGMDVYRFEVFDRVARRFTLDPRYAIAPTIDRLNGIALLETRRDVDTALVDRHGFYTGPDLDGTR